ncbi:recombinase family protein [Streptomyces sp. GXMU-J15]|uniref:Recombinase family protein n=1 Tax=Streptomyces fuscus TaxID=3048495 RepID=A0ABT7IVL9_9ACTN|nr:recombinase family protein [Streptomyces fuscus]MDL2076620.1 recombinase family protein [Streptomyces fuscus]
MATKSKRATAAERAAYDVEAEWTPADLALLEELKRAEALLPEDAPRALLSVRLSVFTDDTTSPVRQELDLRLLAREKGYRVVGLASDLNVSATKVPPWKRKSLGEWLNDRAPEFDALLFWKLDRFIRNLSDLSVMVQWAERYGKNLVSKNDPIDLSTTIGKVLVTVIGGIAEIEAGNTSTRVTSLWEYAKTQDAWLVGKPAYGYVTEEGTDGRPRLAVDPDARTALHWARRMALRGRSARFMVRCMVRSGLMSEGLTTTTLLRRLRNPATLGYRTEEHKNGGVRRSRFVLDRQGQPIRVAPEIFTQEEFDSLQAVLDSRSRKQPTRQPGGSTRFLGVIVCADCKGHMLVKKTSNKGRSYSYMRCTDCKSGGLGIPAPDALYLALSQRLLKALGSFPVQVREYAEASEVRSEVKRLKESATYYMKELEPGGRYASSAFAREQAQATLDKLLKDLDAVDPATLQDRWENVHNGETWHERWESGGLEALEEDARRVGIKCEVTRTKVKGQRAPDVSLRVLLPKDAQDRLVIKEDAFAVEL